MKIVIENVVKSDCVPILIQYLKKDLPKYGVRISDVRVEDEGLLWETIQTMGGVLSDGGYAPIEVQAPAGAWCSIAFDLEPFPDDHAMQVLTSAFEGSGLTMSVPEMPGFRFSIP